MQSVTTMEWLTVKEYADLKRVSEETVRRWLRAGKLEAERTIGEHGHWRIKREQRAA
jgi:excisionase family DNA binding protein